MPCHHGLEGDRRRRVKTGSWEFRAVTVRRCDGDVRTCASGNSERSLSDAAPERKPENAGPVMTVRLCAAVRTQNQQSKYTFGIKQEGAITSQKPQRSTLAAVHRFGQCQRCCHPARNARPRLAAAVTYR